jgi:hypothetical protein
MRHQQIARRGRNRSHPAAQDGEAKRRPVDSERLRVGTR